MVKEKVLQSATWSIEITIKKRTCLIHESKSHHWQAIGNIMSTELVFVRYRNFRLGCCYFLLRGI